MCVLFWVESNNQFKENSLREPINKDVNDRFWPKAALRNESYTHRTTIQSNQKGIYYGELCDCELQDYQ